MTCCTDIICGWFGWCPNADTLRPTPVILTPPSAATEAAIPDGGSGGSGRLGRGASLTLGSLRVLFRNGHLLWFTFFTGFVLLFSLFSTGRMPRAFEGKQNARVPA